MFAKLSSVILLKNNFTIMLFIIVICSIFIICELLNISLAIIYADWVVGIVHHFYRIIQLIRITCTVLLRIYTHHALKIHIIVCHVIIIVITILIVIILAWYLLHSQFGKSKWTSLIGRREIYIHNIRCRGFII